MKLITLKELKKLPKGSLILRTEVHGKEIRPVDSVYVWHGPFEEAEDNHMFAYAIRLTPDGYGSFMGQGSYADDQWDDLPSRFHYNAESYEERGDELFYVLDTNNLEMLFKWVCDAIKVDLEQNKT